MSALSLKVIEGLQRYSRTKEPIIVDVRTNAEQWAFYSYNERALDGKCAFILSSSFQSKVAMCWNKRFLFSCGHYIWGDEVRACHIEKSFKNATSTAKCDIMFSTPYCSWKINEVCKKCEEKKTRLEEKVSKTRELIKEVSESLQRIRRKSSQEEGSSQSSTPSQ